MCSWGKLWATIYKETKKNPQLPLLKSREQKQGVGSKSRVLGMPSAHTTTKGVGRSPKPPLRPTLDTPLPSPHIRNQLACPLSPSERASKGNCYLFSLPPTAIGAPVKPCLNFLSGV